MSELPNSPQLDAPLRSRERAAVDIAVKYLRIIAWTSKAIDESGLERANRHAAETALRQIEALMPEITPGRGLTRDV